MDDYSKKHTEDIKSKLAHEITRKDIILVVGAGVSHAVAGLPTWKELIQNCLKYAMKQVGHAREELEEINKQSDANGLDIVVAANKIRRLLGPSDAKQHGSFGDWLDSEFHHPRNIKGQLIRSILRLRCQHIATTNYDKLLSIISNDPSGSEPITWIESNRKRLWLKRGGYILHLHGVYDRPHTVIFSREDYEEQQKDISYLSFLESLFANKTLIFIGCSLEGVRDPGFDPLFTWLIKSFSNYIDRHYVLLPGNRVDQLRIDELSIESRLQIITYGDSHDDLLAWLDEVKPREAVFSSLIPTPTIGRENEIGECCRWLVEPKSSQVLVLTGEPGIGKTRVALEVANYASTALFPDQGDVVWVDLSSCLKPNFVIPTILNQVMSHKTGGAGFSGDVPVVQASASQGSIETREKEIEVLVRHLQERKMLVLDNFEQVVEAVDELERLLKECPDVKAVITSREAPGLGGTNVYKLERLELDEAISLFYQEAKRQGRPLNQADHNESVSELCRRLDNIPLAIELFAAIKDYSPEELLSKLDSPSALLAIGSGSQKRTGSSLRDVPRRHLSLKEAISWSYKLLSRKERELFCCLSVFQGGAERDAIIRVCNVVGHEGLIRSLMDKSLLRHLDPNHRHYSFVMSNPIAVYASECFEKRKIKEQVRRSHAEYYLAKAKEAADIWFGPKHQESLGIFEAEYLNMNAALEWCKTANQARIGLELSVARAWFSEIKTLFSESLEHLCYFRNAILQSQVLSGNVDDGELELILLVAKSYNVEGKHAWRDGDLPRAKKCFDESHRLGEILNTRLDNDKSVQRIMGYASAGLGLVEPTTRGHWFRRALDSFEAIPELQREDEDKWAIAYVRFHRGSTLHSSQSFNDLHYSLNIAAELQNRWGQAEAQLLLGYALLKGLAPRDRGKQESYSNRVDYSTAKDYFEKSRAFFEEVHDDRASGWSILGECLSALALGELPRKKDVNTEEKANEITEKLVRAAALFTKEGARDPWGFATVIGAFAIVACELARPDITADLIEGYNSLSANVKARRSEGEQIPPRLPFRITHIQKYREIDKTKPNIAKRFNGPEEILSYALSSTLYDLVDA